MRREAAGWVVVVVGLAALAATALPFLPSNASWIRIWDFPRIQIAVVLLVVFAAAVALRPLERRPRVLFLVLLVAALAWQLYRIWPYTPLVATEARMVGTCDDSARLRLLVANVRVGNEETAPLLALLEEMEPDVVLVVESDAGWERSLEGLRGTYPYLVGLAQDNGYGMHLLSRLELIDPEVRYLLEDYVPSIKTGIRLPSGSRIDLYGVHPKPPPLDDTARRDAELLLVGREVRREEAPAIVAGDLNDVAWSGTTRLFRRVGGLLDPRIGRGLYATYNAKWPLLRWPLDHIFFEDSFLLLDVAVMPDIGSDHFPFFVDLCHDPGTARRQAEPEPDAGDADEAGEAIDEGREEASE